MKQNTSERFNYIPKEKNFSFNVYSSLRLSKVEIKGKNDVTSIT